MRFGAWDRNDLRSAELRKMWTVYNLGDAEYEFAECPECGHEMDRKAYGKVHSLPLICPKCKAKLTGFKSEEAE